MAVEWQNTSFGRPGGIAARRQSLLGNAIVWAVALVGLLIFLGPIIVRDAVEFRSPITTDQLRFLAVPLTLLGALFLATRPLSALNLALSAVTYLILIAYTAASYLWSVDPGMTMVRSVAIIMVTIAAMGLALRFSGVALAEMLAVAALVCAVMSLGAYFAGDPQTELWGVPGVRGVFPHKNTFGQILALGFVAGFGLAFMPRSRLLGLATMGICFVGLPLAQSATAIGSVFVGASALVLFSIVAATGLPNVFKAVIVVSGLLVAVGGVLAYELVLEALGRDTTLTGRNDIWAFTITHIKESPWIGHGFRAFWTAPQNEGLVLASFFSKYDQSHNGYLQTLLDLGAIGLGLFLIWGANVVIVGLKTLEEHGARIWFAIFIMVQAYAMAEAVFMAPTGFMWLSMTLAGFVVLASGVQKRQSRG